MLHEHDYVILGQPNEVRKLSDIPRYLLLLRGTLVLPNDLRTWV